MSDRSHGREPQPYISYLLRLWQAPSEGRLTWRASLQDPHTGRRRGFPSLAELVAFLEQETAAVAGEKPQPPERPDQGT